MKSAILFLGLLGTAFGYTGTSPTLTTDGSRSDVVAAIAAAVDGDTLTIPAGTFSWTSGITISGKGIKLQGAGSGRVVARSNTSVTIGTGSKTFTLQAEQVASIEALKSALTGGTALKVARTGGEVAGGVPNGNLPWMVGTITSYNAGTRELVMNITGVNHSGTHTVWNFSTDATTTIVDAAGDNTVLVAITEDTTHSVEVSGIRFKHAAIYTSGWVLGKTTIDMGYASGGQPILVHDCYFEHTEYGFPFLAHTNRGVIWDCSLVNVIYVANNQGIKYTNNSTAAASWSSASTMGMADTTGKNNLYVEDSTLVAWQTGTDIDNGGRVVLRNCLMDHSGALTHGADSSNFGQRHFEIYDNQFVRENYSNATTLNVTKWFLIRGGTGLFARNTTSAFGGGDYPISNVGDLAMWNIQLTTEGPNPHWGKDIGGVQYHCPRQIGFGYVTGAGVDGLGRSPNDAWAYVGDSEPFYIWGNTNNTPAIAPYGAQQPGEDNIADYVQAGRDFFADGTVKPGWTSYTYPHPLTGEAPVIPSGSGSVAFGAGAGSASFGAGSGSASFQ